MSSKTQDEKAMKVVWGKDDKKREAKIKLTYNLPDDIPDFLAEAGMSIDADVAAYLRETAGADRVIDFLHDAYIGKAKQRVRGKLVGYKNGESPSEVSKELLEVALASPFTSLRPKAEATRVKNALSEIVRAAESGEISADMIKAILARTRTEDVVNPKDEAAA